MATNTRQYDGIFEGEHLDRVAFPLGGMGAGMICLEGTGAFSHVSLRHRPEIWNEPYMFAALCLKGETNTARLLQGPVPKWKVFRIFSSPGNPGVHQESAGNGAHQTCYGFPRFRQARFETRFPFGTVTLRDETLPVVARVTGWSPFTPGKEDDSSLPVAALEYALTNTGDAPLETVFSFHAENFLSVRDGVGSVAADGAAFVLCEEGSEEAPWTRSSFRVESDAPGAVSDAAWFRGGWRDSHTVLWKTIEAGTCEAKAAYEEGAPSSGGSLYVPVSLAPGESKTVCLRLSWYTPASNIRLGKDDEDEACESGCCCGKAAPEKETYRPWYARRFESHDAVAAHWRDRYDDLRAASAGFSDAFYDTTLPPEVIESVAGNLTILKSPTVLRQHDGRFWAWEGCCDESGCCHGSCTHVWNYAQALPHLFPAMERSLRETEFEVSQDERGHQNFRTSLPIRPPDHGYHAAADGQLGGIMKVFREWRVSGDTAWLRSLWPRVRQSLEYCIDTWDPDRTGVLREPHHNTYDIEFWGPDGMCQSFYLGALAAAAAMADALGEEAGEYRRLSETGRAFLEAELFNGEYFYQQVQWTGLHAPDPVEAASKSHGTNYSPEATEILQKEGPKYQYGTGCLADGILGSWIAVMCGLEDVADSAKVESHVRAVYRHNFRDDLTEHANPQRPTYALGDEAGLLLCTWPGGDRLTLPFPYSEEVWTGFEYQVASHLMRFGRIEEALAIVRAARGRHDGRTRNPFNEYECGSWYARAMSSYGMLQGLTGQRYDAVEKALHLAPSIEGDFRSFLCTATGYGVVGVKDGEPFVEVRCGEIPVERIAYTPCGAGATA